MNEMSSSLEVARNVIILLSPMVENYMGGDCKPSCAIPGSWRLVRHF